MSITTNKVIRAENDNCIVSVTNSGKINVGSVTLNRKEVKEFLLALASACEQIVAENPEPAKP